jgi:VanZ family protein
LTGTVRTTVARSVAPLALMALIFALSSLSDSGAERETWEVVARKVAHFSEYLLLTVLWAWALRPVTAHAIPIAALLALLYAFSDEFHQTFVEGRTGTLRDVAIDAFGVAVAVALLRYHRRVRAVAVGEAVRE